ncbi:MAG: alpha/beta hydrolase [Gemmataceae bacterium]|nr:alpha/beta hydrolase [Gemmataceae bacterium]
MMRISSAILLILTAVGTPAAAQDKARPRATTPGVKIVRDLAYGPHDRQKLDLYLPENAKDPPLVVWIHGGGWQGGSKEGAGPAKPLVEKGYAVAAINYRLTNAAPFPAQIHDCKGAVRYLKLNAGKYGYDPNRVGVFGASAGGHLVALLGLTADKKELDGDLNPGPSCAVNAVVDWFGPTDFCNWGGTGKFPPSNTANGAVDRLLGGPIAEKKEIAKAASPITYTRRDGAPILLVHGDKDGLVPLQQSQLLHDDLKKWGADSTLHVVEGGGHGAGFQTPEVAELTVKFFARTLKK